jgi:ATP-dependent Clp protease protease subunit
MKTKVKKQEEIVDIKETGLNPIEAMLLKTRTLFLTEAVEPEVISDLMSTIIALDQRKIAPINLYINCPGGDIMAGLALIDLMESIKSPVNTIVMGEACSMGAVIAICGKTRSMSKNSVIMLHEAVVGAVDYAQKAQSRMAFAQKLEERVDKIIKTHTKLSSVDEEIMKSKELWCFADEALEKGLINKII